MTRLLTIAALAGALLAPACAQSLPDIMPGVPMPKYLWDGRRLTLRLMEQIEREEGLSLPLAPEDALRLRLRYPTEEIFEDAVAGRPIRRKLRRLRREHRPQTAHGYTLH